MRLMPRSLFGRLAALAALATIAALAFAALAIGAVLERFVMQGLDQRLDAQVALLATAVGPDGTVDRSRIVSPAPFDRAGSGWGWRIDAPAGTLASADLPQIEQPPLVDLRGHRHRRHEEGEPQPLDWRDAKGGARHARSLTVPTSAGPVRIAASAPREIVERPLRAAMTPLLGSLALLGLALGAATLVQLRLGLRPLATLRESLARVRTGQAEAVPADQPAELKPLADELNALLAENAAALANARGHVANLAHGLKTPLAALALRLDEQGRDPDGAMAAEVARIDRSIRHHLGRARADASGGTRRRTPLEPAIDGVAGALARIHADRAIAFTRSVPPGLALAIDPQDLDELLGNLLDNAWRWAASRIALTAEPDATGRARITIEDDGPGIPTEDRAEALRPGRRLDERGDGHGFGLSIVRELAELHGGTLALEAAPGSGLRAIVALPMAAPGPL
ncbi:MAG: HAMP domain-containing sensor histidine kinase [Sphingomonas sp.]|jgi:signal transduction histidine kinase|uniref:sensor histidine kinase n=1 Tax=Sphingomonas sp. TaxID=28214 RepID=UPI00356746DE